jgi:hypothetical protein
MLGRSLSTGSEPWVMELLPVFGVSSAPYLIFSLRRERVRWDSHKSRLTGFTLMFF